MGRRPHDEGWRSPAFYCSPAHLFNLEPEYFFNGLLMDLSAKLAALRSRLAARESALLAYSGGTDSTFLASVAAEVLGGRFLAATAASALSRFMSSRLQW